MKKKKEKFDRGTSTNKLVGAQCKKVGKRLSRIHIKHFTLNILIFILVLCIFNKLLSMYCFYSQSVGNKLIVN